MSYKKSLEMKIIRTKHIVTFYNKTNAIDILNDLKQVPSEAKLIEILANMDSDEDKLSGHHMLVFELEEKQKENL
jgi:hypothetical protein